MRRAGITAQGNEEFVSPLEGKSMAKRLPPKPNKVLDTYETPFGTGVVTEYTKTSTPLKKPEPAIRLSEEVAEPYYPLFDDNFMEDKTYIFLTSGRNAAKSTVASIWDVLLGEQYPEKHTLYIRQVADTLKTSSHNQVLWVLNKFDIEQSYYFSDKILSDITHRRTGNKKLFRGLDDASKVKSIKVKSGYIQRVIFEEFDQLVGGESDVNKVIDSITRGVEYGEFKFVFIMNPPQDKNHWSNKFLEKMKLRSDTLHIHTDYRQMPTHWVSQEFITNAEYYRKNDFKYYEWSFLGIPNEDGNLSAMIKMEDLMNKVAEEGKDYSHLHNTTLDIGIDVARFGDDRTEIYGKIGMDCTVLHVEMEKADTMEIVGRVTHEINILKGTYPHIDTINIKVDDTGVGGGVTDRLAELGIGHIYPVNNGEKCRNNTLVGGRPLSDIISNVATESWYTFNELIKSEQEVVIPNDYELLEELSSRRKEYTSNGKLRLESKDKVRKERGMSPDKADALILCFYEGAERRAWGWN